MTRWLAIDIGTSAVRAAVPRGTRVVFVPGPRGTPATVALTEPVIVGEHALRRAALRPDDTIEGVLRLLASGRDPRAADALALLLAELRASASRTLGEDIEEAVVTVPITFDPGQRAAVRDAARAAGFRVQRLMPDAVAAARVYARAHPGHRSLLVVDAGGGTSHATILDVDGNVLEVRAAAGSVELGALDVDTRLAGLIGRKVAALTGSDFGTDADYARSLRLAAEQARTALATADLTHVRVVGQGSATHRDVIVAVAREEVDTAIADLGDTWRSIVADVLDSAGYTADDIDDVLVLGSGADLAPIRDAWRTFRSEERSLDRRPPETVVTGAAIEAAALEEAGSGATTFDVSPAAVAMRASDGRCIAAIAHHSSIPARRRLDIDVDSPHAWHADVLTHVPGRGAHNEPRRLTRIRLADPDHAPEAVTLVVEIDADGLVSVAAVGPDGTRVRLRSSDSPSETRPTEEDDDR